MKHFILWVALFLPLGASATDTLNIRLYRHALEAPETRNVPSLVTYLVEAARTKQERAEVIFYWITSHIAYDLSSQEYSTYAHVAAETTLRRRKTICSGYTQLYATMASYAGLQCRTIIGYTTTPYQSGSHAWNAVLLDNRWRLVDATWGSGGTVAGTATFVQQLDLRYLFADPDFLLTTHLPNDSRWQLAANPINLGIFRGQLWQRKREVLYQDEAYLAFSQRTALLLEKNLN
ncbi:transglutaminase domain-containing protein [Hymenobacter mucosus]|uniref:Transglutaminase-like superfamily protein n=1 Tax=Hymenobacter mucosus TaxID=1411120 RepID=A0A238XUY2_9BACT|nr:transglutaminase domain-containing protein [Hymenobacter mucosus]SNR62500.1 Transglutaminase-like superfamily protein [Hymenobacter mucosus]